MHMNIRYHFLADLHITRHARETESEKRIQNNSNKPFSVELVTSRNRDYRPYAISERLGRATSEVGNFRVSSVEREAFFFSLKYYLKWNLAAMGRTRWRNELSSSSSSENSPRQEAKQNPADADVAAMGCSADKQDDTNPFPLDVWNALKRIENNTDSLIKDIKDLQNNHSNFLRPR